MSLQGFKPVQSECFVLDKPKAEPWISHTLVHVNRAGGGIQASQQNKF